VTDLKGPGGRPGAVGGEGAYEGKKKNGGEGRAAQRRKWGALAGRKGKIWSLRKRVWEEPSSENASRLESCWGEEEEMMRKIFDGKLSYCLRVMTVNYSLNTFVRRGVSAVSTGN